MPAAAGTPSVSPLAGDRGEPPSPKGGRLKKEKKNPPPGGTKKSPKKEVSPDCTQTFLAIRAYFSEFLVSNILATSLSSDSLYRRFRFGSLSRSSNDAFRINPNRGRPVVGAFPLCEAQRHSPDPTLSDERGRYETSFGDYRIHKFRGNCKT